MQREVKEKPRYAVVAAVQLPSVTDMEFEASLSELRELAKTLGFEIVRTFIQKRSSFDTTAYLGVGKRQEIHHFVNHEAEYAELPNCPTRPKVPTRTFARSTRFWSITKFHPHRRAISKRKLAAK